MNNLLELCVIALTLATSISPSLGSSPRLKMIRGNEATASAEQAMQRGISVQLPVTSNAAPMPDADNEGALIVSITENGGVYFGIDPIPPATLPKRFKGRLSNRGPKLFIKADARTPYSDVVKVLDAARTAGIEAPILLTAQPELSERGTLMPPNGLEVLITQPLQSGSESTILDVLTSGQRWPTLKINHELVPWATVQSALRHLIENRSQKVVLVKAERLLPFAQVVHVIDMCRSTGANVVLGTSGL